MLALDKHRIGFLGQEEVTSLCKGVRKRSLTGGQEEVTVQGDFLSLYLRERDDGLLPMGCYGSTKLGRDQSVVLANGRRETNYCLVAIMNCIVAK